MKKLLSCVLSVVFAASCFTIPVAAEQNPETVQIQIISTSDGHGKFLPYDYALNAPDTSGSLSQTSSAFNELINENTILVDVGDTIQGNSAELFIHDEMHPMVRAQNLMNYDVWVLGNHEFNYGMDVVKNVIDQHDCNVLCGNVYYKDGTCIADHYVILERAGVKIGIIGMVTPNIVKWDKANLEADGIIVTDPAEEIRESINELKDKVDVIVAACHMDCENEYGLEDSGVYDVADKNPELDLILAAHGHKKIEGIYRNDVLITENNDLGKTLSLITLTLEKGEDGKFQLASRESVSYDMAEYEEDPKISEDELIVEADARAKEDATTVIGRLTNEYLSPEDEIPGITQAKLQDTALIRLINDVQMYYTGAKISGAALFVDSANLYQGDIQKCDMALVYKYANTLYKLSMTGNQLKKWMEWSYNYINTYQEGDLSISFNEEIRGYNYDMFSGVKYEVDISQPVGSRIQNLTLPDGTPIDMEAKYEVAVNNYRAYSQLLSYGEIYTEEDGLPELLEIDVRGDIGGVRELIGDYIMNVKGVPGEDGLVDFTVEDVTEENANWKLTGFSWDEEKHAQVAELVKEGKLELKNSQDGRYTNTASITEADLEAALLENAA